MNKAWFYPKKNLRNKRKKSLERGEVDTERVQRALDAGGAGGLRWDPAEARVDPAAREGIRGRSIQPSGDPPARGVMAPHLLETAPLRLQTHNYTSVSKHACTEIDEDAVHGAAVSTEH